jgi:hypothetical protein
MVMVGAVAVAAIVWQVVCYRGGRFAGLGTDYRYPWPCCSATIHDGLGLSGRARFFRTILMRPALRGSVSSVGSVDSVDSMDTWRVDLSCFFAAGKSDASSTGVLESIWNVDCIAVSGGSCPGAVPPLVFKFDLVPTRFFYRGSSLSSLPALERFRVAVLFTFQLRIIDGPRFGSGSVAV